MRIMLRFSKEGPLRWISHLDTMRTFQKALRRAAIPVALSQGFNPHQKLSLAAPLSVGVASRGEYLDLELKQEMAAEEIRTRLNGVLPAEMRILAAKELDGKAPSLMAAVQLSRYRLRLPAELSAEGPMLIAELLQQELLPLQRTTKKGGLSEVNLRPAIIDLALAAEEGEPFLSATIETSSQFFLRLQELVDLLAERAGRETWPYLESEPLRIDLGLNDQGRFRSLLECFAQN